MKHIIFLLFLSFSLTGFSQNDTVTINVFPNPFDSIVNHIITINKGDILTFELFDIQGRTKYAVNKKPYFESVQFSEKVDSIINGIFISFIKINDKTTIKKLIYNGSDSNLTLNFDIQVTPSKLKKETLNIFPNPSFSGVLTIETETESKKVEFTVFNMQGQLLYKKEIEAVEKTAKTTFLISDWESGQYIARMTSKFGNDEGIFTKISN